MLSCLESALAEENGCRLKPPLLNTSFHFDLGIAVAAALLFSLLFYKLRLPMIVGQLVAGMVVGPFGLGLIRDTTAIDFLSTLGIILLLFVIGLELDPRHLKSGGSKAVVLTTFGFSRYIGPRIINRISQYELEVGEISFLLALSFGFLFGVLSDYLGFSPGIGALLTGFFLPVKHSRYVREKILPLKEAFIVFFFLSMGALIDVGAALSVGLPLALILGAATFGKFVGGSLGARLAKTGTPLLIGSILVPRGEFSLVLAKAGVDSALVSSQLYPVAGLAVLATTLASPIIQKLLHSSRSES